MEEPRVPRRLAAILAADVAGYTRLTGADEEGTIARLRALRSELIDPAIEASRGRVVKRTGDGILVEFASVVEALRCALEVQRGMAARNAALAADRRIEFRVGINLGDVVVEGDDLLGDGVNVAARLEGISETGGICLSEDAYRQVQGKVAAEFADMGEQSLKNVARPVRVYRVAPQAAPRPQAADQNLALPDRPSIAVLPFQNMSGDAEQDYFCDGMVEDIITGLSRIRWLFVIARNSSFVYKGKAVDIKQVGRELGVRYVLEGSVRKAANRVRITGQLVEAATGRHLWAERYDRPLDDIFALQDEITLNVVGAIEPNLRAAEIERVRRKRPDSLDAYDLYLQALATSFSRTAQDHTKSLALLERVLALEPGYVGAHALMADNLRGRFLRGGGNEDDRQAALLHARAELAAGCDDANGLAMAAFVIAQLGHDAAAACEILERALQISPSSMVALTWSATVLVWMGRLDLAIERAERARRFDPLVFFPNVALAEAHFLAGRYADAADAARRATDANPRFLLSFAVLAAALVRLGRIDEAKTAIERARAVDPEFRLERLAQLAQLQDLFVPFLAALREAGLE